MPRILLLLLCALLGACSMRSAIEAMSSPEDRAFAQAMVDHLRSGDEAWLRQNFRADLWEQSVKPLAQAPALYPDVPGETEIVGFNVATNNTNGVYTRTREFTLVTHGGGRWTVTNFRTLSTGGPDQVVQWSVVPHSSPPPALTTLETFDAAMPWIWGVIIAAVLLFGGLIFWLVRRSRRKHRAA